MEFEELKKIGLEKEEIEIYLTLLKHADMTATEISKELDQARTTIYRYLESLEKKGLASSAVTNNVTHYFPTEPERIPEILEERKEEVQRIIPQLNEYKSKDVTRSKVELYKGTEGIKTILRGILREGKEYTLLGEAERFFNNINIFSHQWIKKANKKKISGRLLCPKDQNYHITDYEEIRFIDKELLGDITTWTYGDKTAQFIWSEPEHIVLIHSGEVTRNAENVFNKLWEDSEKPSEKQIEKFRSNPYVK